MAPICVSDPAEFSRSEWTRLGSWDIWKWIIRVFKYWFHLFWSVHDKAFSPQPVLAWAGVSPVLAAAGRCQWFSQWSETDTEKQFQFFTDESSEINIPKSLVHVEPFWHNFLCHSIVCGRRPLTLFQIQKDFKFIQEFPSSDLPAFTPRVWQVYHVFLSCLCVCVFVVELSCNTWACMLVKFEILYIMLKSNQKQWKIMKTQHVGGMFRLCTTHKC